MASGRWTQSEIRALDTFYKEELKNSDFATINISELASKIYAEVSNRDNDELSLRTEQAIRVKLHSLINNRGNGETTKEKQPHKLSHKVRNAMYRLLELAEELDAVVEEIEDIEDWLEKTFALRDKVLEYKVEKTGVVENVKRSNKEGVVVD